GSARASHAPSRDGPRACLEGIRVLDLSNFIAGPFCPLLLAELGADVVKVEAPGGDPFRFQLFGFVGWNRGKRSLVLDLKRAPGHEVFLDLVRRADVVVENFRPGVMDRLGIGWDHLARLNARLVHVSITGYGSSGPLAALPGFDPIFQARSGFAAAQGGDDAPVLHMIAYNDYCAGALGALATVAALTQTFAAWARTDALARLAAAGVPAAPALEAAEIWNHPWLRASGCLGELAHPTLGRLDVVGPFIHLDATPATLGRPAPL